MDATATIGLISDTHGLMRQKALGALTGSDLIIHCGDVGQPGIIEQLLAVAPLVAVRGDVDTGIWASALPMTAVATAGATRIYVLHDLTKMDLDPAAAGFNIVVSGHSHRPSHTERSGVIYLNPGSAGPRRFRLPITVARIDLRRSPWSIEFIDVSAE